MFLAQRCNHEFDSKTKARGEDYSRSGHVSFTQVRRTGAAAQVKGSYGTAYLVELDWSETKEGFVSGRCTCPRFDDGFLCKHLWAFLLKLDEEGYASQVPGNGPLDVVDLDDWKDDGWNEDEDGWDEDAGDDWIDAPRRVASAGRHTPGNNNGGQVALAATSDKAVASRASWRQVLQSLKSSGLPRRDPRQLVESVLKGRDRLACYVISAAASQYEGELVIELAQQERRADGTLTEPARTSIREDRLVQFRDPADQRILAWAFENAVDDFELDVFGAFGGIGPTAMLEAIRIRPHDYDSKLPELCGTGRLVWSLAGAEDIGSARPVAWDGGAAWKFVPRVTGASGRSGSGWVLDGSLVRGDERRDLSEVVLALKGGLVLFEDRLSRLERDDHLALLDCLRIAGPISVPADDRNEFLETLLRLPYFDLLEVPDELRLPEVEVPPRPLLRVKAPQQKTYGRGGELQGEILFRYGEIEVSLGDPRARVLDAEHHRLMPRGGRTEEQRLAELRELPLRLPRYYDGGPGEVRIDRRQLHDVVDKLIELGWEVEAEGLLVKKPGKFDIQVVSNVDWFELHASVDYDGTVVQLPALLSAVKKGEKYVRLDDGSQGMLPQEWLTRFEKLAGLGDEEHEGIRFGRSQALLLDALLADQDARVDRPFRKLRDRLRTFQGVKPATAPRGFQGDLRDYQKSGLGWFKFLEDLSFGGCLADDMGLGKTVQVLGLLQHRRTRPVPKSERTSSLCVVPKSLVFNWIDEAARFTPRLRVVNYTGLDRKQRQRELAEADLIITTYGTLRRDIVELKDRKFDYVILDEAQAIKNHNSQAAKACRLLTARQRLALTGTPIENHLGELWSLFEFLNPGMLGNCTAFRSLCRGIQGNENGEALGDLSKAISPFVLRRTKEQVLKELPEKTEQTIHCELSRKERKEYDSLRDYYRARVSKQVDDLGMDKARFHVLEALLRLRQAACHPGLVDKKRTGELSAKLQALLEQIREVIEEGHKALVFSQFTSLLAIVRQHLDKEDFKYEYLDGRTRKRKDRVQRFQNDPACPLFLISLKAGGHGLNLTAADYVFILDPWWNPAVEAQAIDRTHRIGQTRRVFAYRLIAKDTVEEKVLELQKHKRELADAIVTANESLIRKLTAEDLEQILS